MLWCCVASSLFIFKFFVLYLIIFFNYYYLFILIKPYLCTMTVSASFFCYYWPRYTTSCCSSCTFSSVHIFNNYVIPSWMSGFTQQDSVLVLNLRVLSDAFSSLCPVKICFKESPIYFSSLVQCFPHSVHMSPKGVVQIFSSWVLGCD